MTDVLPCTAAGELRARMAGRGSYVLAWSGIGMKLTARTHEDILLHPPGFTHARIVTQHHCEAEPK